jgi:hypothetical protein
MTLTLNTITETIQQGKWNSLLAHLKSQFGADLKVEAILLLIGIQEIGIHPTGLSKEQKTDLIHVGTCTILEDDGYYKRIGKDQEGWPIWELQKPIPYLDIFAQKTFLRDQIIKYFEQVYVLDKSQ